MTARRCRFPGCRHGCVAELTSAPIIQIGVTAPRASRHNSRMAGVGRTARRLAGAGAAGVLLVVIVSRLNPFMTSAVNNRLESPCADPDTISQDYDRSAWTPLLWSCEVEDFDGSSKTIRPW